MRFIDVSNWQSKISSTKGTRDKGVIYEPETGDIYFIKFPMIKENRDYSMETWSEIIAYEVGTALGFNVLRYDFAIKDNRAGCISKNMVGENESLVEGDSILTAYDPTYNPEDKKMYSRYTFQFVMDALRQQGLYDGYEKEFVRILIFDSIIGNSDRHQSNWGAIQKVEVKCKEEKRKSLFGSKTITIGIEIKKTMTMTPIYDSGCCLGREFNEEQIKSRLDDENRLASFIQKGYAELRGEDAPNVKKNHFELLRYICSLDDSWKTFIYGEINRVVSVYDENRVSAIINNIDNELPPDIRRSSGLSDIRKEFIIKVIDRRIKELKSLTNETTH